LAFPRLQYVERDSALHALGPLSKLLVLLIVSASVFVFEQWYVTAAIAVLVVVLYPVGGLEPRRLLSVLKPLPVFIVLVVLAHVLLIDRLSHPWASSARGLLQGLKIAVLLASANLFLTVTDPVDLSDSVLRAMRPVLGGRRAGELSLMVMIVFSFLPLIARETERLSLVHAVRCGFQRGLLGKLRGVIPLLAPLVIGVFRRAEEMELSLAARCYNIERPRYVHSRPGVRSADLAVMIVSILLFALGIYAKLQADH
jgi:energy-coupling factor transporter transmembrane protein EcfT